MKKGICYLIIALLAIIPCPVLAQEGGKISFGALKVIPSITLQSMYDDNIYLKNGRDESANKKVSDLISHVKPSLGLNFNLPQRLDANITYRGDWAFYRDNNSNNWKNNGLGFNADYKAPAGLVVSLKNEYQRAEDPYGADNLYAIGRVTKRWSNGFEGKAGYNHQDNFMALVYYNTYKQQYLNEQDFSQDYADNEIGLGVQAKFLPKTWGFVRYFYGKRDYDSYRDGTTGSNDADNKWHKVNVGVTWDQGAKLGGEVNFGYQWKTYDNPASYSGQNYEDKNTWIAATQVNYKMTETTFFALSISRAIRESGSNTNEYFTDTGIGFSVKQKLLTKLTASAGVSYSRNEFNTRALDYSGATLAEDRTDNNYNFNAGLDYAIQEWLGVGAGYAYKKKSSNSVNQEYEDNQVSLQLKLIY